MFLPVLQVGRCSIFVILLYNKKKVVFEKSGFGDGLGSNSGITIEGGKDCVK